MLKKIMIAVALFSGFVSSGFAITQQELVAALNTPEAQAKIKEQVAALVREKGLPAEPVNTALIATYQNALNLQILEKLKAQLEKKDVKPTFWKACAKNAKDVFSFVAPMYIGYAVSMLALIRLIKGAMVAVPLIGEAFLWDYLGNPVFGGLMQQLPVGIVILLIAKFGLDKLEKKLS